MLSEQQIIKRVSLTTKGVKVKGYDIYSFLEGHCTLNTGLFQEKEEKKTTKNKKKNKKKQKNKKTKKKKKKKQKKKKKKPLYLLRHDLETFLN